MDDSEPAFLSDRESCSVGSKWVYIFNRGKSKRKFWLILNTLRMARDIHQALKTEIVKEASGGGCNFTLVRMQWSRYEVGFGLHANPTTYSMAGFQRTDFVNLLGFHRSACSFLPASQCYSRFVPETFEVDSFAERFDQSFQKLLAAEKDLEVCGYVLPQPEGWAYFSGKPPRGRYSAIDSSSDGHTGANAKQMKISENNTFKFVFSWLETPDGKGWTIHYRPKHPPVSAEMDAVFKFLGVKTFRECPEFDFEECYFRFIPFLQRRELDPFGGNAQIAHNYFDSHQQRFAPGVEQLLSANAIIEKSGLKLLPIAEPKTRHSREISRRVIQPVKPTPAKSRGAVSETTELQFDVAVSFAGTSRAEAEKLAKLVRDAGYSVFYDEFYPELLWGKDLTIFFDDVYRKRSRYCVMFVSKDYVERPWTIHERRSAMARALAERGSEYILPVQVDGVELPGLPPTIGYVPLNKGIATIAKLLIKKLK